MGEKLVMPQKALIEIFSLFSTILIDYFGNDEYTK